MKRSLIIFLGILFLFFISSCQNMQENIENKVNKKLDEQIKKADTIVKKNMDKQIKKIDTLVDKAEDEIKKNLSK